MSSTPGAIDSHGWPPPNYTDPETKVPLVLGVTISMTGLMLLVFGARVYSRWRIKHGLGPDDWIMMSSVLCSIVIGILGCVHTTVGLGYHTWDLRPTWPVPFAKIAVGVDALIFSSMSLTKISLCVGYLRLFASKRDRTFSYIALVYLTGCGISLTCALTFSCIPLESLWDTTITDKKCIDYWAAWVVAGVLNSLSDFLIFLWPIYPLRSINLPWRRRLGLLFLFTVGTIVCVVGVCRVWYFTVYTKETDIYYAAANIWIITNIEINLAITCACLPAAKPLFSRHFPGAFGTNYVVTRQHKTEPTYPLPSISKHVGPRVTDPDYLQTNGTITGVTHTITGVKANRLQSRIRGVNVDEAPGVHSRDNSLRPDTSARPETSGATDAASTISQETANRRVGSMTGESEEWIMPTDQNGPLQN